MTLHSKASVRFDTSLLIVGFFILCISECYANNTEFISNLNLDNFISIPTCNKIEGIEIENNVFFSVQNGYYDIYFYVAQENDHIKFVKNIHNFELLGIMNNKFIVKNTNSEIFYAISPKEKSIELKEIKSEILFHKPKEIKIENNILSVHYYNKKETSLYLLENNFSLLNIIDIEHGSKDIIKSFSINDEKIFTIIEEDSIGFPNIFFLCVYDRETREKISSIELNRDFGPYENINIITSSILYLKSYHGISIFNLKNLSVNRIKEQKLSKISYFGEEKNYLLFLFEGNNATVYTIKRDVYESGLTLTEDFIFSEENRISYVFFTQKNHLYFLLNDSRLRNSKLICLK